jgi:hypothetical protein
VVGAGAVCPRDGARLRLQAGEYPNCLHCGYEDYSYDLPKRKRRNALARGVAQLRYIGFAAGLEGQTITVRLRGHPKAAAAAVSVPSCPWCNGDMKAVPKSGYGKNDGERTYKCRKRHRILLYTSTDGEWRGWT